MALLLSSLGGYTPSQPPCGRVTFPAQCLLDESKPRSAMPSKINEMAPLKAPPFPGNLQCLKNMLIMQPPVQVFSYLKGSCQHSQLRQQNVIYFRHLRHHLSAKQGEQPALSSQSTQTGPRFLPLGPGSQRYVVSRQDLGRKAKF